MAADAEQLFKALGDTTRLRILALLLDTELCMCEIEGGLSLSQPNASRHTAILRTAGIIQVRKQAQWTYCKISDAFISSCPDLYRALICLCRGLPTANADRAVLNEFRTRKTGSEQK